MKATIDSIQMINFKSFRRALIPLPPGLIAITGPNGSGKSNILDAIAFVMGWRAKRLRAPRIEHLVRKGSQSGCVILTINNSPEKFKLAREVRPNGESVYRINGGRSSASDAFDLLSELGFITDRYAFVTQGDITSIVEMSPKDRTHLLEEISGVAEYDDKKAEALEELSKVDQSLREMRIILRERERELNKVLSEIKTLEKRKKMETKLREIKKYLLLNQLEETRSQLGYIESLEIKGNFDDIESQRKELELKEAELRNLEDLVRESPARRRRQLEANISSLKRQKRVLEEAINTKKEGLSVLMREKTIPKIVEEDPSFLGIVSQLITPLDGYEIPYLAVGGSRLNDIVVEDLEGAKRIARKLRKYKGRFRIIPMDVIRPRGPPSIAGSLGPLYKFLEYNERFESLARLIFNAILMNDLDNVGKDLVGKAKFVTMGGEIFEREGSLLAGKPERNIERINEIRKGLFSLEEELKNLLDEVDRKKREISSLSVEDPNLDRLKALRETVSHLRKRYGDSLSKRRQYLAKMEEIGEKKGMLEEKVKSLESELKRMDNIDPLPVVDPLGEIASIQTKLRIIGPTNPRAEEEYEIRREEYENAKMKYEKFSRRDNEIVELIRKIDKKRESIVAETLRKLSEAFNQEIKIIFEGGSGSLELTDKGLEMRVKLPEKKPVSIDSLSGGEKSLSAIAFILAAQKLRPSPLYVFDEADSMLDGVNCKMYTRALKELSKEAQVIVISLKKETLEEADHLVGVTMKDGQSKIIAISREAAS